MKRQHKITQEYLKHHNGDARAAYDELIEHLLHRPTWDAEEFCYHCAAMMILMEQAGGREDPRIRNPFCRSIE